ncbi:hypothetical protein VTK56DRAFT_8805 [Thermocarpiscus australiensis]
MSRLDIRQITRISPDPRNLEIREGYGIPARFTVPFPQNHIFSAADPDHPTAFLYDPARVPLLVRGAYVFAAGRASYRLRGTGPGNFQITSQAFDVTGTGAGPAVEFTAGPFSHQGGAPGSPFKLQGDWTWSILRAADDGVVTTSVATPLEIYFMFGNPALPGLWPGIYLLDLIRLAFPDYQTVAGQPWANVEGIVIRDAVRRLWGLGGEQMHYDSRYRDGGSTQHLLGTEFNVGTFMTRARNTCNCHDLAALVKVTLGSLGTKPDPLHPGAEVPVVSGLELIGDQPWGYIPAGPLFGWQGSVAHDCNNPYWRARFGPFWDPRAGVFYTDAQPNVERTDANRTRFATHCYVVFNDHAGARRVVDICHATLNPANQVVIADGALDVPNYRAQSIDIESRADSYLGIVDSL